jgi:hypothetical protein
VKIPDDTQFTAENWTDAEGNHQGGVSYGPGFTIHWQRGPLTDGGQNGAFLITVLLACIGQLQYFQNSKFASKENQEALNYLSLALQSLRSRKSKRQKDGILGTHEVGE